MTRRSKLLLIIGGSLLGLIVAAFLAALLIVRTDRFRNFARDKIIAAIYSSTGGRAEVGQFNFDPRGLHAHIEHFVIHGKEPPGAAPFLEVKSIDLQIKLLTGWKNLIGLESLQVDRPVVNVMVLEDGETNIPSPETIKKTNDSSALETVVDLAIRHFDIRDGSAQLSGRKSDFSARGDNLTIALQWNLLGQHYQGKLGLNPLVITPPGGPPLTIAMEVPVQLERDRIRIDNATVSSGRSHLTLSGAVENMRSPVTSADLTGSVSLEDVAQMLHPDGTTLQGDLRILGHGKLTSSSDYSGEVEIDGAKLTVGQGGHIVQGIHLAVTANADPMRINLKTLRIEALGGEIVGSGDLKDLDRFTANAQLRNFDLQSLASALAGTRIDYASSLSGNLTSAGSLKDAKTIGAHAQLSLAGRPSGVPLSGRIVADYDGARGELPLKDVQLALPNSRLDAHGVLGKTVDVRIVSGNLRDFAPSSSMPVALKGGSATLTVQVRGPLSAPQISGHAALTRFSVNQRNFDRLDADLQASGSGASAQNGRLTRGNLEAQFAGSVGLHNWRASGKDPMMLTASMRNGDLADVLALAGQSSIPASGALTVQANIAGTIGNPQGTADLTVAQGTLYQEPFDTLQAAVRFSDQLIEIPSARLVAGSAMLELKASYAHPSDSLTAGRLQAQVSGNNLALAQLQTAQKRHPGLAGTLQLNAAARGDVRSSSSGTEFILSSIAGDIHATELRDTRESYGNLNVTANTSGSTVTFRADSNFAGSTLLVNGQTQLAPDYPTSAHATINALPIDKVLSVAGNSVPAKGSLSATADLSGTKADFRSNAEFRLTNGALYQEPFTSIEGTAAYTADSISISRLALTTPAGSLQLAGSFSHPTNDFDRGRLELRANSTRIDLARVVNLQNARPGLAGGAQITADIAASLETRDGHREVLVSRGDINGNVLALALNKKALGNASLKAETSGKAVSFTLQSDIGKSDIEANGQVTLATGYPVAAKLTFKNVTYSGFQDLLASSGSSAQFDAIAEGQADITGPVTDVPKLRANLQLSRLEVSTKASGVQASTQRSITLQNQGPIVASLQDQEIRLQNARFAGPSMQLAIVGTAPITQAKAIDLTVNGNVDLKLLEAFDTDVLSDGSVALNGRATGTISDPRVTGRAEVKNVSLHIADAPNGLSDANGVILLNGNSATIQTLTARIGGGETSFTGSATFGGANQNYNLQVRGTKIRTRYQGASIVSDLNLNLRGSSNRSNLSGDVTIQQLTYAPESDLGSMLYKVSAPAAPPNASSFLSNMRLNVRIRTAPSAIFRTTLAQAIQASVDLSLRGTAQSPGMAGRVDITQGTLVFFGNPYTVTEGNISFYNAAKIEPIVAIGLETKAKGVLVNMRVSGPMDDLKLSYTSDPPLKFEEIVALLATGKTPSDPTVAAHQPPPPNQTVAQMGESSLVQQTIANPLANRLQRVFGVSQLKIDPTFTSGSTLPQARLTLQQQVTPAITFTYSEDLTQSNSQLIRVEWAFTPRFSAVVTREENGMVALDFFYKKQFR
jgi:translocation and assembly module TamB